MLRGLRSATPQEGRSIVGAHLLRKQVVGVIQWRDVGFSPLTRQFLAALNGHPGRSFRCVPFLSKGCRITVSIKNNSGSSNECGGFSLIRS